MSDPSNEHEAIAKQSLREGLRLHASDILNPETTYVLHIAQINATLAVLEQLKLMKDG